MKTGRNAPCPCGSGKKYKRCCLPKQEAIKFKPRPEPPIINHHYVQRDGVWQKAPGRLKMAVVYKNEEDVDGRIEQVFQPVFSLLNDLADAPLIKRLHDCRHKLYAVRWHKGAIISAIEKEAREVKNNAGRFSGVSSERENPELIYLTENFLFQVVSCIEVLTQTLHHVIPCLMSYLQDQKSERKKFLEGKKLVKRLGKSGYADLAGYLKSQWDEWLEDLTEMRNTVAHKSALKDLRCFQEDPYDGNSTTIHYPRMPDGQHVHDYCEEVLENVVRFYEYVLGHVHTLLPRSS